MSKKQTRRTISFNQSVYEALKRTADRQGKSIAHFVTDALRAAGVELPPTEHVHLTAAGNAVHQIPTRSETRSLAKAKGP